MEFRRPQGADLQVCSREARDLRTSRDIEGVAPAKPGQDVRTLLARDGGFPAAKQAPLRELLRTFGYLACRI
jgi:hypothetical protein